MGQAQGGSREASYPYLKPPWASLGLPGASLEPPWAFPGASLGGRRGKRSLKSLFEGFWEGLFEGSSREAQGSSREGPYGP